MHRGHYLGENEAKSASRLYLLLGGMTVISDNQTHTNPWHQGDKAGCQMSVSAKITPTSTIPIHFQMALKVFPRRFFL